MTGSRLLPTLALLATLLAFAGFLIAGQTPIAAADDHGDVRSEATSLRVGPYTTNGVIDPSNSNSNSLDRDYFSFDAKKGASYTFVVEAVKVEKVHVMIVDPEQLPVQESLGQVVTYSGTKTTIEWVARTADTYFVEVKGAVDAANGQFLLGEYTIRMSEDLTYQDIHSDFSAGGTPILLDNVYRGSISPWANLPIVANQAGADDLDFFSFDAIRGARYTAEVELATSEGVSVAFAESTDDIEITTDGIGSSLSWISPADKRYHVRVSGTKRVRSSLGSYSLKLTADTSLQDLHPAGRNEATAVNLGSAHQGAISPANDTDYFSLRAQRGVRYTVNADLGSAEGINIEIQDRYGARQVSNFSVGTTIEWLASADGEFLVVVSASTQLPDVIGSYALKVEADTTMEDRYYDSADRASPISFGTVYQGAISPTSDVDYLSFPAERGAVYTVQLTYGTADVIDVAVKTRNSGNEPLARNFGASDVVRWISPSSDTYYVELSGSPRTKDPTGTYSLRVDHDRSLRDRHSDETSAATRIGLGNTFTGAISPLDDRDYFYFAAERGLTYTVSVNPGTAETVGITVENPQAAFSISNFEGENWVEWTAPQTGGYLFLISAASRTDDALGTYELTVTRPNAPSSVEQRTGEPATEQAILPGDTALTLESRTIAQGRTVHLPIMLDNAEYLTGLSFSLNYAPDTLRVANVYNGPKVSGDRFSYNADLPGVVRFGFALAGARAVAGSAAVVEFEVIGEEQDVSPLTFTDVLVSHSSPDPLEVKTATAELTVGFPIIGDGDGDGRLTILDAFIALKEASKAADLQHMTLDMNGDGQVTELDARLILESARPA